MEPATGGPLSFRALFGPRPDYPFFSGSCAADLHAGSDLHLPTASLCADASLLSYVTDRETVNSHLRHAGFEETRHFSAASTHACLASAGGARLLFFRGTEIGDMEDLRTDLRLLLTPEGMGGAGGRVHEGFQRALDEVWPALEGEGVASTPLICTGHSLGGALALLAASRLSGVAAVYNFGAPRVGDARFRDALSMPVYRFVNNNDLVPHLPPPLHYRHAGREILIDREGKVLLDPPGGWELWKDQMAGHAARILEAARKWCAGDLSALPWDALVDHAPLHYARALAEQRSASS